MKVNPEHEVFFKHLIDNGCITKDQYQHYGVTTTKVINLRDSGLLKIEHFTNPITNDKCTAYVLSKEGKRFLETRLGYQHFYRSNSLSHDYVKGDFYCNKLNDFQRLHYMTAYGFEQEFKHVMGNHYDKRKYSMLDGAYPANKSLTEWIAHDVITKNYPQEVVEAKGNACGAVGMKFEKILI